MLKKILPIFSFVFLSVLLVTSFYSFLNLQFASHQTSSHAAATAPFKLMGINFAGPDFGEIGNTGWAGGGSVWVSPSFVGFSYMQSKKLTLIRMPIAWEVLEPTLGGPLAASAVSSYGAQIAAAQAHGEQVLIELHNYGMYKKVKLTTADATSFSNSWKVIATEFSNKAKYPAVWGFELMNEPHNLSAACTTWESLAQAGLNGIRTVDTNDAVLIPGDSWQSAQSWPSSSDCLKNVTDTAHHMYYSAHEYFDANGTYPGGAASCSTPTVGVQRLAPFTSWLSTNNALGLITEFGVPTDACYGPELDNFLNALYTSPNMVGGTYWAAFPSGYNLDPVPKGGGDTAQGAILGKYPSIKGAIATITPTANPTTVPVTTVPPTATLPKVTPTITKITTTVIPTIIHTTTPTKVAVTQTSIPTKTPIITTSGSGISTPTPTNTTTQSGTNSNSVTTTQVSTTTPAINGTTAASITSLDTNANPTANQTYLISTNPVFSGTGNPGDTITITIHSTPITQATIIDKSGSWQIQFTNIEATNHTVLIQDTTPNNTTTVIGSYTVNASKGVTTTTATKSSSLSLWMQILIAFFVALFIALIAHLYFKRKESMQIPIESEMLPV